MININHYRNVNNHNEEVKKYWMNWTNEVGGYARSCAIEGFKSLLIVNGATIIASLGALSGEYIAKTDCVIIAAKISLLTGIIGLSLAGIGQARIIYVLGNFFPKVRANLLRKRRRRLYAIGRYLERFFDPKINFAEYIMYSSLVVFILGAIVSGLILVFLDSVPQPSGPG